MSNSAETDSIDITYREELTPADPEKIEMIVRSTGFFSEDETAIAVELADERITRGDRSGYHFIFAERGGRIVGYACYGPIPGTKSSFDLYWIAVLPEEQCRGLGKKLVTRVEELVITMGGTRIYVDTSTREQYGPTRSFYLRSGYREVSVLEDFYDIGDGKLIFEKRLF